MKRTRAPSLLVFLGMAAWAGPLGGLCADAPAAGAASGPPQAASAHTAPTGSPDTAARREPTATANQPGWIRVATGGRGFVDASSGRPFTPRGFNYDRDHKMRLLEDYWEAEWATVVQDFREMKALGANVVRVHLQFGRFMTAPDRANEGALAQLRRLLALAEQTGLHLDITGLGCYRKTDVPRWLDALEERVRWQAQASFWRAVARTCADSPAVFCYDLINEPFVPAQARQPGDWLAGELAGFCYVQALALDAAGRAPHEIAGQWTAEMVAAIRQHDRRHLVTLGFLPNSGPDFVRAVARHLDFVSVHIYPASGQFPQALQTLRNFRIGKPLLVEEIFPLHCRAEELIGFMRDARSEVAGWISFYWGQTPEELTQAGTIGEAITREWLQALRSFWSESPGRSD